MPRGTSVLPQGGTRCYKLPQSTTRHYEVPWDNTRYRKVPRYATRCYQVPRGREETPNLPGITLSRVLGHRARCTCSQAGKPFKVSNDRWRLTRAILLHVSEMWDHTLMQTIVYLVSGPFSLGFRGFGTENATLLTFDRTKPRGTSRYLLPWDKRAPLFVFNDRSRLTSHMFVLLFSQFLSHPVIYDLLSLRWYRSFTSVRKEPWTNLSRWGYFFLNLLPVLDVFLFPVVFACFFTVHLIKRLRRKTRGW